jgi:hypothetical protein
MGGRECLTTICEPIVWKMWRSQRLPTLFTFKTCCNGSFTFLPYLTPWNWVFLEMSPRSPIQAFCNNLWNPKFHYHVHWCPILNQIVYTIPTHHISQRSILIWSLHLCIGLHNVHFPSGFSTKTLYAVVFSHTCSPWPSHHIHVQNLKLV